MIIVSLLKWVHTTFESSEVGSEGLADLENEPSTTLGTSRWRWNIQHSAASVSTKVMSIHAVRPIF